MDVAYSPMPLPSNFNNIGVLIFILHGAPNAQRPDFAAHFRNAPEQKRELLTLSAHRALPAIDRNGRSRRVMQPVAEEQAIAIKASAHTRTGGVRAFF